MKIILDEREVGLYERIMHMNTDLIVMKQVLQIGDAILQNDDKELCIIERKTLSDLLSSIKDGRYEEQSHRLLHTSGLLPHNIIYVIEGHMSTIHSDNDKQLIFSSITSLNYYKGFSVFRTSNINDTADLIIGMANKIIKNTSKGIVPSWNTISEDIKPYTSIVKKTKKDNITSVNISEIMLCQIPGISTVTSCVVFTKFGSMRNLIRSLTENPDCMNNLSYMQSGKERKISSTALKNIKEFLMV
jgi:crossover junction endonuclease MUS81